MAAHSEACREDTRRVRHLIAGGLREAGGEKEEAEGEDEEWNEAMVERHLPVVSRAAI